MDLKKKVKKNESLLKNIIRESINKSILRRLKYLKNYIITYLLTENVFRYGSEKYFDIIREAREMKGKRISIR